MKYCNNCGNPLEDNQRFCDRCGQRVDYTNYDSNSHSTESRSSGVGKIILIIIAILIFLSLIVGLLFGAYKLFLEDKINSFNDSNNSSQSSSSSNGENEKNSNLAPSIDILTTNFNSSFMNADNRHGYEGVSLGMTKNEVNNQLGSSDSDINVDGVSAEKHGNIAVHYDNNIVDRYFVVPNDTISIQQFINQHGKPTLEADNGTIIYDDNTDNAFTIKVYNDGNGNVSGVENIDAIERDDLNSSNSDDDSNSGKKVTSEAEAEKIGKDYLDNLYGDDYWYHSVDKWKGVYRVNYGQGAATHAHSAVYINEDTGKISEENPNE
ncbi:zinc ribbon domain-containing protein [Staphylococcus devriesei]|uniref:zinc ribbon domain-containing protein n=1 Tax=Staphylococcus devriesei TaxID=586733 RepID=UPI001F22D42F|nr:zinc ribbon domain-containing protein [Staphylococcus devriesei]MCE5090912.1 zinc ribbon domain-containing protein [Staphylococcus devriesei]